MILEGWDKDPNQRPSAAALAKRLDTLWQAERKQIPISSNSSSSSMSSSASSPASRGDAKSSTQKGSFTERLSLVTFSKPPAIGGLNSPTQWQHSLSPIEQKQAELNQQRPLSSIQGPPPSPKPVKVNSTQDAEMKRLLEEMMRMKLEQEKDKQRILEMEKKAAEQAQRQAEGSKRRAEEVKEIQRQPEPKNPFMPTAPGKSVHSKLGLPPPLLSKSRLTIAPAPKPVGKPAINQETLNPFTKGQPG